MDPPDKKQGEVEEATGREPPHSADLIKIMQDYVNDLREILRKLRSKLH